MKLDRQNPADPVVKLVDEDEESVWTRWMDESALEVLAVHFMFDSSLPSNHSRLCKE